MLRELIFLSFIFLDLFVTAQEPVIISLNKNWEFQKESENKWMPATVPGSVHTDLFANKLIADPFFGDNEKQLQWIENENWEYKSSFAVDKNVLLKKNIEIIFKGLDTYAKVYLNDSLILSADNMFREWNVEVKRYLKENNTLLIIFESATKKGKDAAKQLPYVLPGEEKVFTRKAQYQYGWDWGPRFVTCGIWKDVFVKAWDDACFADVQIINKATNVDLAMLSAVCSIYSDTLQDVELKVSYSSAIKKIHLQKGENQVSVWLQIDKPKFWWCNGLGEPYLYSIEAQLCKENSILDKKNISYGIRDIKLIQKPDLLGKSFYFELNGVPVFMKGANYIPSDNFVTRTDSSKYAEIIDNAVKSNMNMLRVWGGGIYENDIFYNLCDQNGILVWQDFMFACAMYPGDSAFVNNVKQEAVDQVVRLRNHACIALWCGNNEIDEGWKNWEWQKQFHYSEKDSMIIWNNYKKIFEQIFPDVTRAYNPQTPYWPSSPSIGWGRKESLLSGDSHYWGVWWGMEPFEIYNKKVGRFMSEYGFQGMPDISTIQKIVPLHDMNIDSAGLKNHQKHPMGFQTIQSYLEREYKQPKDFESYIYVSQLLQAYGIKTAIEAHRRAKPYCMGSLYWQLNDCWPVVSWSGIDYYGKRKAMQYFVKDVYEDLLLSEVETSDSLNVFVVSDHMKKIEGLLTLELHSFDGKLLWSHQKIVSVPANSSGVYYSVNKSELLKNYSKNNLIFRARFVDDKINYYENLHYFVPPKEMQLSKPNIDKSIKKEKEYFLIHLKTNILAKNIYLSIDGTDAEFSNNYFDLLPTDDQIIQCKTMISLEELKTKLKIESLYESYSK